MTDLREVTLLQTSNRWLEAKTPARRLRMRTGEQDVLAEHLRLGALQDRDEAALALVWLRQEAHETPRAPRLADRLADLLDNPHYGPTYPSPNSMFFTQYHSDASGPWASRGLSNQLAVAAAPALEAVANAMAAVATRTGPLASRFAGSSTTSVG